MVENQPFWVCVGEKYFNRGAGSAGRGEECFNRGACGPAGVPGAGGPGRCVCRWAAARPRAVRAASFARRVDSLSGQALPPPTGTAAGPSGALHVSGAWALIGGSIRCPETQLWLSTSNFACNSPTILSNSEIKSLELQRFQTLLKLRPIELHAIFRFLLACHSPVTWLDPAVVSAMLHVIRLRLFQTVNSRRWNFNVSGLLLRVDGIELRATFPGVVSAVTRCSLWRPSCRCGLVCCCGCWPRIQLVVGTKFALLGLLAVTAVQSSPCSGKTCQIGPLWASRASFIPHMR